MPDVLVLPDSIARRADVLPPAFGCSWRDGGLDIATTPQLKSTLRQSQLHARLVVLDRRGLALMDISGLHVIIDASVRARQIGRRLVVLRGPPNVDRVFTPSGRFDDVEIHDLDPGEPPVEALLRLADEGPAS
jgi:anti-anti-sigma factor